MPRPPLGKQELEVLRYVTEKASVTVGEVAEGFGEPNSLARSTVKTVMERLEKKGYLVREKQEGVFRYRCAMPKTTLLHGLVSQFVEKTLAGSLSPFVAYLADGKNISDEEFAELKRVVEQLQAQRKEGKE